MKPDDEPVGEPAPWPYSSERHAGHARLRRACAALLLYGITVLAGLVVLHYVGEWLARAIS